jgi:ABC-type multidrug transport system permease subunit
MYFYAGLFGILSGLVVSLIFHMYSRKTTNTYARNIFGVDSNTVIKIMIVVNIIFLIVIFSWLSLFIRDVTFPMEHPFLFLLETLLAGILPSSTIFIIYYLRNIPLGRHAVYGFVVLVVKCMVAHILFQLSGVYSLLK